MSCSVPAGTDSSNWASDVPEPVNPTVPSPTASTTVHSPVSRTPPWKSSEVTLAFTRNETRELKMSNNVTAAVMECGASLLRPRRMQAMADVTGSST